MADILKLFQKVVKILNKENCQYALAGGVVTSLYRDEKRFTEDIDFLVLSESSESMAKDVLKQLGFKVSCVKLHQLQRMPMMNKKSQPNLIITGRSERHGFGVDFILPEMPWFESALHRAQSNKLDFGFGLVPSLTVEDVMIAKVFAGRLKDLDDILSILRKDAKENQIDYQYFFVELQRLGLKLPREVLSDLPKELKKVFKKL